MNLPLGVVVFWGGSVMVWGRKKSTKHCSKGNSRHAMARGKDRILKRPKADISPCGHPPPCCAAYGGFSCLLSRPVPMCRDLLKARKSLFLTII
jgi:hypothetical protein